MKKLTIVFIILSIALFFFFQEKRFTNDTIIIGSSLPKSGIIKEYGRSVFLGANAYFSYVNKNNILPNKKIKLITYDDKYEPRLTLQNTERLLKNKNLFALFGFVGTPTVKNILPIIYNEKIPFIGTFSGASFLRNNQNSYIINVRNSYRNELKEHINYLLQIKKFSKIAVFYQNDEYGEDGYISVVKELKKHSLSLVGEGNYKRNTLSIRHAFNSIKEASPEAIIMIGANKANTLFIKRAKKDNNFQNTLFCNISFGDASEMAKELDGDSRNIIFSQVVPNYQDTSIPIIKEYHEISKEYNKNFEPSFISLEAFISAKILVAALKEIDGDITRSKFIKNIHHLPSTLINGIHINSDAKNFLNKTYLFKYENKQFIEIKNESK